jgi:hypothetical protein
VFNVMKHNARMGAIILAGALGLAAIGEGAALAQSTLPSRSTAEVYNSVTLQDVAGMLAARGYITEIDAANGLRVVRAYRNERDRQARSTRFFIALAACDRRNSPPGCLGIHMLRISTVSQADVAKAQRVALVFHSSYSFGRVYLNRPQLGSTVVVPDYYTMPDKGVTIDHLKAVIGECDGLIDACLNVWNTTT